MRKISDEVCREHSLSIIENLGKGRTKSYTELDVEKEGRPTLRGFVRNDIDEAIAQSNTKDQFLNAMADMGYTFDFNPNHKYPTLQKKGAARRFRFYFLGKGYDFEEILDRIYSKSIKRYPAPIKKPSYYKYFGKAEKKGKLKGFKRIYVRFMFLMGIIPKENPIKPTHPLIREAVLQMRKIQEEYKLLARFNITTDKQLLYFKDNRKDRLKILLEKRSENTRLIRNEKNENKLLLLRKKGKELTEEISELKKDVKLCDNILTRSIKMQEDLQKISKDEIDLKEDKQHEHIRRSR